MLMTASTKDSSIEASSYRNTKHEKALSFMVANFGQEPPPTKRRQTYTKSLEEERGGRKDDEGRKMGLVSESTPRVEL